MPTTLTRGIWPVCTAAPPMPVPETRPGAYRLTPIPGSVNRTCQATTTTVAVSRTVATTWRSKRAVVVAVLFMVATIAVSGARVVDAGPNFVITGSGQSRAVSVAVQRAHSGAAAAGANQDV